jgi:type IX secretion system PorP/SprF family membrane protein
MRQKQFLFYIFALLFFRNGIGQQLPQYTQWTSHQFALNPAHAGIKNCLDIHSLFRSQWVGFDGAPKSGFLTFSAPMNSLRRHALSERHGFGVKFEYDNIGPFASNRLNLAYASHFNFTADKRLSLGLYAGFVQFNYAGNSLTTIAPDPTISKDISFMKPDATFGAWWNTENYYLGMTIQNIFRSKWDDIGNNNRFQLHTTFNGGARLTLNKFYTVIPSFLLKIPPTGKAVMDINVLFNYLNKFGIGGGLRNTNAFLCLVNFKINSQFSVHYSFDYTLSSIHNNTHEFSIIYNTCKKRETGTTKCALFE